jgi:hypothetical protein
MNDMFSLLIPANHMTSAGIFDKILRKSALKVLGLQREVESM